MLTIKFKFKGVLQYRTLLTKRKLSQPEVFRFRSAFERAVSLITNDKVIGLSVTQIAKNVNYPPLEDKFLAIVRQQYKALAGGY